MCYLCFLVAMGDCATYVKSSNDVMSKTILIDHFTVVSSVTWPLNGSKVGAGLVLIQTLLLLLCRSSWSYAN